MSAFSAYNNCSKKRFAQILNVLVVTIGYYLKCIEDAILISGVDVSLKCKIIHYIAAEGEKIPSIILSMPHTYRTMQHLLVIIVVGNQSY
jgi:hypothetical protein